MVLQKMLNYLPLKYYNICQLLYIAFASIQITGKKNVFGIRSHLEEFMFQVSMNISWSV